MEQQRQIEGLVDLGWRQGSVLTDEFALQFSDRTDPAYVSGDLVLAVSQDCDLVHRSLDVEPVAEMLLARQVEKKNGALFWGKNPRRLQFETANGLFEASVLDRFLIARSLIAGIEPDQQRTLDDDTIETVRTWLGKRYKRAAFPDTFNDRLRPAERKVGDILKKKGHKLTGIYLLVSDDELPEGTDYRVQITATLRVDDFEDSDARSLCQQAIDRIVAQIDGCDGIEVEEGVVLPESDVSLDDLRLLKRWDYDSLTFRALDEAEIAPEA